MERVDGLMNRFAGIVDLAAAKTVQEIFNPSKADSDQMEQKNQDNIWLYYEIERLKSEIDKSKQEK
jgi:hypothetical protein